MKKRKKKKREKNQENLKKKFNENSDIFQNNFDSP